MTYVEWLRVRNALRVLAIVLGVIIVVALILRVAFAGQLGPQEYEKISTHARTSHVVLPDGTRRTVIDEPSGRTHITVDDHGYFGQHIVVTEPNDRDRLENDQFFSASWKQSAAHGTRTTAIDTDEPAPLVDYLAIASIVTYVLATVLGAPLARENEGHLEIAMLRPVSRERFALGVMLVDVAGMFAGCAMAVLALIAIQAMFEVPKIDFHLEPRSLLTVLLLPLAWYAMLACATASLRRGAGAVQGLAWPAALLVVALAVIPFPGPIGAAVHAFFGALAWLDPLTNAHIGAPSSTSGVALQSTGLTNGGLLWNVALIVVYGALAIVQWRRLEA